MDFNFSENVDKSTGGGITQGHGDHSPTKLIDISSSDDGGKLQHHQKSDGSGSNDDFEHVYHDDPFTAKARDIDNILSSGKSAVTAAAEGVGDVMEDFLGSTKSKVDDFKNDIFNDFEIDHKKSTIDFMAAERGGGLKSSTQPPPPLRPSSSTITKSSVPDTDAFVSLHNPSSSNYTDAAETTTATKTITGAPYSELSDYQKEHYNPSPVKKSLKDENDEKFISSEDLLGDFKDERMRTPEPSFHPLSTESKIESSNVHQQQQQQKQHSGIEDLLADSDSITAAAAAVASATAATKPVVADVKEDISKISGIEQKSSQKSEVEIPPPAATKKSSIASVEKKNEPASQQMISAEEIFYKYGLDTWFKPQCLHPKVESLIYWRDVKKSGIVFGAGLVILLAISCFSVISVFAYVSLLTLAGTICFRIYKTVMGAVQKTSEGHPFKEYLEMDLNLPHEKVQQIVNVSVAHVNGFVSELRRLFLVEDLVDSIKFVVILWVLTYVGAWFNGMTLVILAFVSLFTLPKVYENNKQSIDTYLELVRSKILEITDKVKAAIPIGKKPETDKDK